MKVRSNDGVVPNNKYNNNINQHHHQYYQQHQQQQQQQRRQRRQTSKHTIRLFVFGGISIATMFLSLYTAYQQSLLQTMPITSTTTTTTVVKQQQQPQSMVQNTNHHNHDSSPYQNQKHHQPQQQLILPGMSQRLSEFKNKNNTLFTTSKKKNRIRSTIINKTQQQGQMTRTTNSTTISTSTPPHHPPATTTTTKTPNYHIVFSTGCSIQQEWESFVFFYHAWKVHQPGTITRIVSGCRNTTTSPPRQSKSKFTSSITPMEVDEVQDYFDTYIQPMSSPTKPNQFKLHFTPEYGRYGVPKGIEYKYMNKPHGMYHWMTNVLGLDSHHPHPLDDDIIILMDPDMILLRPILHDYSHQRNTTLYMVSPYSDDNSNNNNNHPKQRKKKDKAQQQQEYHPPTKAYVTHGHPIAQQDGYLDSEWMKFNISYITQGGSLPSYITNYKQGGLYWNAGPPYLATVRDMYQIVTLWKDYVPRIYEEYPKLFAEMYGYIIASTQLNLSHTLIQSLVVSTTLANQREGWPLIDDLPNDEICNHPRSPVSVASYKNNNNDDTHDKSRTINNNHLPVALHYCKRYFLGKWFFSKYRLKKNFISCEAALLTYPPRDSPTRYNYWVRPPPDRGFQHESITMNITTRQAKREAFMLCGLINGVNDAARYYKYHYCPTTSSTSTNNNNNTNGTTQSVIVVNWNETYDFFSDPYS